MQNHQIPEMSTTDVQSITKAVEHLQAQFASFSLKQDRLIIFIKGNTEFDEADKGMVGEVAENTQEIRELKKEFYQFKAEKKGEKKYFLGIAAATAFFLEVIQLLVNYFSNHQTPVK